MKKIIPHVQMSISILFGHKCSYTELLLLFLNLNELMWKSFTHTLISIEAKLCLPYMREKIKEINTSSESKDIKLNRSINVLIGTIIGMLVTDDGRYYGRAFEKLYPPRNLFPKDHEFYKTFFNVDGVFLPEKLGAYVLTKPDFFNVDILKREVKFGNEYSVFFPQFKNHMGKIERFIKLARRAQHIIILSEEEKAMISEATGNMFTVSDNFKLPVEIGRIIGKYTTNSSILFVCKAAATSAQDAKIKFETEAALSLNKVESVIAG